MGDQLGCDLDFRSLGGGLRLQGVLALSSFLLAGLELIDAAGRVYQVGFTSVERVALGADFDAQVFAQGGTGGKAVATGAGHRDLLELRVNAIFHGGNVVSLLRRSSR